MFKRGMLCNWGKIDSITRVADGIICVTTPSHGGYILSETRLAEMDPRLRECSFTNDRYFEEDCSWVAVALQWPHLFPLRALTDARDVYRAVYAKRTNDPFPTDEFDYEILASPTSKEPTE